VGYSRAIQEACGKAYGSQIVAFRATFESSWQLLPSLDNMYGERNSGLVSMSFFLFFFLSLISAPNLAKF
jgi:hypothetical protein